MRAIYHLAFCVTLLNTLGAQQPGLEIRAREALRRACAFYRSIATEGGYLWAYSSDLKSRWGEGSATATQIWVQPPGTPSVGMAYLRSHAATGESPYLDAALAAGMALARGQLAAGGWDYHVDFDPDGRKARTTTFDDDVTQSALRFLLELAKAARIASCEDHSRIDVALRKGLDALLLAQYPNGAWPQRWNGQAHDPRKHEPRRASFPANWTRTHPRRAYSSFYTFNDNTIRDCICTALAAWKATGEKRFLAAVRRGADFILRAQLPAPQPTWAQQYDAEMYPAWARRFEPPAACSAESRGVAGLLLDLYLELGDESYLAAAGRAAEWFASSEIAPGRWARYYELTSNRPLYFTRDYKLVYHDRDLPTHYSFQGEYGIPALIARYRLLARREQRPPLAPDRAPSAERVIHAIESLDEHGRWLTSGRIESRVFVRNATLISSFLAVRHRRSP